MRSPVQARPVSRQGIARVAVISPPECFADEEDLSHPPETGSAFAAFEVFGRRPPVGRLVGAGEVPDARARQSGRPCRHPRDCGTTVASGVRSGLPPNRGARLAPWRPLAPIGAGLAAQTFPNLYVQQVRGPYRWPVVTVGSCLRKWCNPKSLGTSPGVGLFDSR